VNAVPGAVRKAVDTAPRGVLQCGVANNLSWLSAGFAFNPFLSIFPPSLAAIHALGLSD
jgi:hypothetical protein